MVEGGLRGEEGALAGVDASRTTVIGSNKWGDWKQEEQVEETSSLNVELDSHPRSRLETPVRLPVPTQHSMAPTNALGSDTDSDRDDTFTSTSFKVNERFADKYDTKKRTEELSKRTLLFLPLPVYSQLTTSPSSPPFNSHLSLPAQSRTNTARTTSSVTRATRTTRRTSRTTTRMLNS